MANPNAERAAEEISRIVDEWFAGGDQSTTGAFAEIIVCLQHRRGLLFPEDYQGQKVQEIGASRPRANSSR